MKKGLLAILIVILVPLLVVPLISCQENDVGYPCKLINIDTADGGGTSGSAEIEGRIDETEG